jgi:hypothetical protein
MDACEERFDKVAANLSGMWRVLAWALIAALAVLLMILAVPFLEGLPNLASVAVQMPWQPWGIVLWLICLLICLSPVIAVWLILRSSKLTR